MRLKYLHPRHTSGRFLLALAVGLAAGLVLATRAPAAEAATGGWDVAALLLATLAWLTIGRSDAAQTRTHAARDDPGRTLLYAIALATSAITLLAAVVIVRGAKNGGSIALCLATVALSWTLTHTTFALRYAHLYYGGGGTGSGVKFPGDEPPAYFDFAYLAFTLGMTFQVSDTSIESPQIRRAALLHGAISFAYNTAILAFVLNLLFSLASPR